MFSVITICCCTTTLILAQDLPFYLNNFFRTERNGYEEQVRKGLNYYKVQKPVISLSKLYKPRPAELDKLFMEYERIQENILPSRHDQTAYNPTKLSSKLKINSPIIKYKNDERPLGVRYYNEQKDLVDYNEKEYYSNIKPPHSLNNIYNYLDTGYKTTEENYEDEKVHYDFSYVVSNPLYNVNFGHRESKDGQLAKGLYYTLLPDGRTQYVEYKADDTGFKPKITYENSSEREYK